MGCLQQPELRTQRRDAVIALVNMEAHGSQKTVATVVGDEAILSKPVPS
jgi:hypothetical protein